MQQSYVRRPFKSQQKVSVEVNIFKENQVLHLPQIPQLAKNQAQSYHFIGPQTLRQQILSQREDESKVGHVNSLESQRQSLIDLSKTMQTSVNRSSFLSKLSKHQNKELTREARNLQYYKDYQQKWSKQSNYIRKLSDRGSQPTLLETNIKKLLVIPNPEKDQLVKNYVNTFWEMSLRNNNIILKRHIKGNNKFEENQLQGLLQIEQGRKIVQNSIPKLPLQKLKKIQPKQFRISGKNKLEIQSLSSGPSRASEYAASRLSKAMTDGASLDRNQQILKMNYDSSHRFLKDEPIYISDS